MTSLGWQLLAFAVSALQALAQVPPILDNDAGSGADAPADPLDALLLSSGAYVGNLTFPDDADWYALRGTPHDPACFEARTTLVGRAEVTMALAPSLQPSTSQVGWPGLPTTLALATPNPQGVWFGLAPAGEEAVSPVSAGTYAFELSRFGHGELGEGDAGTGADAGDAVEDAIPAPFGCFGGNLDRSSGDMRDVFTFDADEGDVATLSLTNGINSGTVLDLVSPSGAHAGSVTTGNVTATTLDETGLWQIHLSHRAPTPGQYMIALSLDRVGPPDDPPPCQPACMEV